MSPMGKRLVVESLTLRTATDEAIYRFSAGVTAVSGPIGSGKSSLLELIKYALGGRAQVMPAVRDNVTLLVLRVRIGDEYLELTRALGGRLIDVVDLKTQERKATWATTNRKNVPYAGRELLTAAGIRSDLRVPRRRSRPMGDTVAITFYDVYRYLYLDQNNIDNNIVGHNDPNLNVKRIAVFELLYGLSNPRLLELTAERGRWAQEAERVRVAARNVQQFLRSNLELDPETLDIRLAEARQRLESAEVRLADLRSGASAVEADTDVVREIATLRSRLDDLEEERRATYLDIEKDRSVLAQLELDELALRREEEAAGSLTGLEFTRCPRCLQSIEDRRIESGHCLLCTQAQPIADADSSAELRRIRDQRTETNQLLAEDLVVLERTSAESEGLRSRFSQLLELAGDRLRQPADPLLDEVADASRTLAEASADMAAIVAARSRWASYRQLNSEGDEAEAVSVKLAREEAELRLAIEENSTRIDDLSAVFNETLASLRDPWYQEAYIRSRQGRNDDYLPMVDNEPFDLLSVGGARKTLVNLAYHLANLSMAVAERIDVLMPTFLIVDSPRKNVGAGTLDRSVVHAVYDRLRTLQDASGNDFQIIIVDNELPLDVAKWVRASIELDYDHPLVPGVRHPSREGLEVETMGDESTVELV
jgi:AAA domain